MAEALKNAYNENYINKLAESVSVAWSEFDKKTFVASVFDQQWPERELKDRRLHICDTLHACLPLPYAEAIEVLKKAAPDFGGYEAMFFPDFVERYGLDDWDVSIPALEYFTQYSSSEFAVRPFIEKDPERMITVMKQWAEHDNEHVRRLASEGCRPRLPWAGQLKMFREEPKPILPILRELQQDESLYVRKSVANNLNDISKDHPRLVLTWAEAFLGQHKLSDWVIRHGLRTLLKQPHPEALQLFGYSDVSHIKMTNLELESNKIRIGDTLCFKLDLQSKQELGKLRVEYAIDYMKANGKHNQKVFMLLDKSFDQQELQLRGSQSFREMTTRKHYPGEHRIYIRVNGMYKGSKPFELLPNE